MSLLTPQPSSSATASSRRRSGFLTTSAGSFASPHLDLINGESSAAASKGDDRSRRWSRAKTNREKEKEREKKDRRKGKGKLKLGSKAWLVEGFKGFGRHIARNQIRVLIIDSFVMTTLFYPALTLHFQRNSQSPLSSGNRNTSSPGENGSGWMFSSAPTYLDIFFPLPESPFPPSFARSGVDTDVGYGSGFFWDPLPSGSNGTSSIAAGSSSGIDGAEWEVESHLGTKSSRKGQKRGKRKELEAMEKEWRETYGSQSTSKRKGRNRENGQQGGGSMVAASVDWIDIKGLMEWSVGHADWGTGRAIGKEGERFVAELEELMLEWDRASGWECVKLDPEGKCVTNLEADRGTYTTYFKPIPPPSPADLQPTNPLREDLQLELERLQERWEAAVLEVVEAEDGAVIGRERMASGIRDGRGGVQAVLVKPRQRSTSHTDTGRPSLHSDNSSNSPPTTILILYAIVLAYFLTLLSRATHVHSRFGLAFTGVVELGNSSIMAFSIMSLLGFGNTAKGLNEGEFTVPYYILPFVILIVGVENMSAITRAVYSVPVSYSVPDRVGLGLAKVGPSLLFTSITDIAILTSIGLVVNLAPVRDFCLFASILIVVHFWMLITFFLTVLSIDCQRLELDDLLRQGSERPNAKKGIANGNGMANEPAPSRGRSGSLTGDFVNSSWIAGARRAWRARTARGGSLVLILTLLTGLYYVNESRQTSGRMAGRGQAGSSLLADTFKGRQHEYAWAANSTGAAIWQLIKPKMREYAVVHVLPTTKVLLPSEAVAMHPVDLVESLQPLSRPCIPRLTPVYHLLKVFILPQIATAFVVYLILLYLLKDADLLDAQRNKRYAGEGLDEDEMEESGSSRTVSRYAGTTVELVSAFEEDIVQVALAEDAEVGITVASSGKARLFRIRRDGAGGTATSPILAIGGMTYAAIDRRGRYACFVVYGKYLVWMQLGERGGKPMARTAISLAANARVTDVRIGEVANEAWVEEGRLPIKTLVGLSDGSVWEYGGRDTARAVIPPSAHGSPLAVKLFVQEGGTSSAALVTKDQVEIWRNGAASVDWSPVLTIATRSPIAKAACIQLLQVNGELHLVFGEQNGSISIWHLESNDRVWSGRMSGHEAEGDSLQKVDVVVAQIDSCKQCDHKTHPRIAVSWSTLARAGLLRFEIKGPSKEIVCSCSSDNLQGLQSARSANEVYLTPSSKRNPRRLSRTMPITPSPSTGRRSPSSSASRTVRGNSMASAGATPLLMTGSDTDEGDGQSSPPLARPTRPHWVKVYEWERPIQRGGVAVDSTGTSFFAHEHNATGSRIPLAPWRLEVMDAEGSRPHKQWILQPVDEAEPLNSPQQPLVPPPTLASIRAQRLAQLAHATPPHPVKADEAFPLLAFPRLCVISLHTGSGCLIVAANQLHIVRIPVREEVEEIPPRRSTDYHIGPLSVPTMQTARK